MRPSAKSRVGSVLMGASALLLAPSGQAAADEPAPEVEAMTLPVQAPATRNLLPLDLPLASGLRYGVDAATLSIGTDRIVRYVVVIQGSNLTVQAWFEGLRCASGEVKTYARWSASTQSWSGVANPSWRALDDNQPSRHALAFARQGACITRDAVAPSVDAILRNLRSRTWESDRTR